jgi:ubiquinone/menaquinone biosynthesis C-methylase UbiE
VSFIKRQEWGEQRSQAFARMNDRGAGGVYSALARKIARQWVPRDGGCVLLELGSGPGLLAVELKKLLPNARIIVTDPSEPMISIARKNADEANFRDIETILGAAERIPVDSATVDVVISQQSLHEFADLEKAFSEMRRVLKPGGKAVITDWNKSYPRWRFYLWCFRMLRRMGWQRAREASYSYRRARRFDEVSRVLLQSNFIPVETQEREAGFFICVSRPQ